MKVYRLAAAGLALGLPIPPTYLRLRLSSGALLYHIRASQQQVLGK